MIGVTAMHPVHKIVMTLIVAACAAILGTLCLDAEANRGGSEQHDNTLLVLLITIIPASMIYWSFVGYSIRRYRSGVFAALSWGIVSPFIGSILAGLPVSYGLGAIGGLITATIWMYITIPIGVATGLAVWLVNRERKTAFTSPE